MNADQTSEPTLLGRHLTRAFGQGEMKTTALNDVSITLERGHVALLMGPSGSGKSTLLAVLSGLLRPDGGQVMSLGQDIWKMSDAQRERFRLKHCGFIFQGYNLFAALSARQQLEMVVRWGEGASAKDARRRADEMLTLLGLGKKSHLRPSELSGGEKQRVAIGRALDQGAGVLLRRRADQRARLGARRTGDRAAAQRRPRARLDGPDRGPRRPHHPLRGSGVQPGRRLPARRRGRGPPTAARPRGRPQRRPRPRFPRIH